ncbi:MAG TPA: hypothetical protein PLY86_22395 [bacterium]|nr:hypothetical protein [bacterium]
MPRIHTAVVPDRTEKIAFFCRDENENPLPSPVLETGPVHVEPGDTVVIQSPMNERGDRPLVIYIAGPYSAPTLEEREANTRRSIWAFWAILSKGHYPICPHLSHYPHELFKQKFRREIPYEVWIELDKQYLIRSDAIYYMAPSPGAENERRLAVRSGKLIFHALGDIPDLKGDRWSKGLIPVASEPKQAHDQDAESHLPAQPESVRVVNGIRLCPECWKQVAALLHGGTGFFPLSEKKHGLVPPIEGGYQPVTHLENPVPPGGGSGVMPPLPKGGTGQSADAPTRPTRPEPVIADEADKKPFLPKPTPPPIRLIRDGEAFTSEEIEFFGKHSLLIRNWRVWPWNWWRK